MTNIELLKELQRTLNIIPNRKYGDTYALATEFGRFILQYEKIIWLLSWIKKDIEFALKQEECSDDQRKKFEEYLKLINEFSNQNSNNLKNQE